MFIFMMSYELKQALKRPKNYNKLTSREQWDIDKRLGILDWDPTEKEIMEYVKRRNKEK